MCVVAIISCFAVWHRLSYKESCIGHSLILDLTYNAHIGWRDAMGTLSGFGGYRTILRVSTKWLSDHVPVIGQMVIRLKVFRERALSDLTSGPMYAIIG